MKVLTKRHPRVFFEFPSKLAAPGLQWVLIRPGMDNRRAGRAHDALREYRYATTAAAMCISLGGCERSCQSAGEVRDVRKSACRTA